MEVKGKVQAAAPSGVTGARVAAAKPHERAFWVALACAAVAHAVLVAGFVGSLPQRQMGEKGGMPEGVSVAMVDAADLKSRSTLADEGGPAGPVAPARTAMPTQENAVTPAEEQTPRPVPPIDKQLPKPTPAHEAATQDEVSKEQKREASAWPIDPKALEAVSPSAQKAKPPGEPDAASKAAVKKPEQPKAARPPLQLSLPDAPIVPRGGGTDFARPAGITRSGENDEFGRGVIRALRKTMPDMDPERGRVTVRLLLSQDGNLVEVHLVRSSGNPMMDRSVIFAVRQSSFPFPPPNAPPVDRTFVVTYIYR